MLKNRKFTENKKNDQKLDIKVVTSITIGSIHHSHTHNERIAYVLHATQSFCFFYLLSIIEICVTNRKIILSILFENELNKNSGKTIVARSRNKSEKKIKVKTKAISNGEKNQKKK